MAQMNPNFEIDFNDINSYEQIQLINDTQLAKENLLMHRAYKEPADDAIIRNQFSSFTFVDFCPKLFSLRPTSSTSLTIPSTSSSPAFSSDSNHHQKQSSNGPNVAGSPTNSSRRGSQSSSTIRHYELETFSDLFERINVWLKLNKDWRVVSMETLIFDCTTQFNHLKSSIHTTYLPRNTRGLRLFLSPSKSRFSGPQKIGCINVVPRKISGSHNKPNDTVKYESLDQILARLNELLLTKPIEGRILSVETLTLPMVDGYVNTDTNYFMDNRLNLLAQDIYSVVGRPDVHGRRQANTMAQPVKKQVAGHGADQQAKQIVNLNGCGSHTLIDILRVYYEFGPMVCGLVNLIDFVPRFYSPTTQSSATGAATNQDDDTLLSNNSCQSEGQQLGRHDVQQARQPDASRDGDNTNNSNQTNTVYHQDPKITATESLTRLLRRSLSWFETERKRVLEETGGKDHKSDDKTGDDDDDEPNVSRQQSSPGSVKNSNHRVAIDLKVCNLQIHHKTMFKNELIQVNSSNVVDKIDTRLMSHQRVINDGKPVECAICSLSTATCQANDMCSHLVDLCQPYDLKYVRLAYVIPVYERRLQVRPLRPLRLAHQDQLTGDDLILASGSATNSSSSSSDSSTSSSSSSQTSSGRNSYTSDHGPDGHRLAAPGPSGAQSASSSSSLKQSKEDNINGDDRLLASGGEVSVNRAVRSGSSKSTGSCMDECQTSDSTTGVQADCPSTNNFDDSRLLDDVLSQENDDEECSRRVALEIISKTKELHRHSEIAHQLQQDVHEFNDTPIGQLTYRLFAPCQLINSSSCFSINPVNSSNPLARRGSVDINGGGGGLSSENAHPSSLLLPPSNGGASTSSDHTYHAHQQVISFGAFFPALSHDIFPDKDATNSSVLSTSNAPSSANSRFTTNEFESVEAIRRRMEVYVTTNSMKVLAGETLIVNLSDVLSCLSTAIEQTVVKSPFAQRNPSTWVSVYVLYSAVDRPQLPALLLEQLKLRERLGQISETDELDDDSMPAAANTREAGADDDNGKGQVNDDMIPVFDDDFKPIEELKQQSQQAKQQQQQGSKLDLTSGQSDTDVSFRSQANERNTIRIERNPTDSSLTLYNSAYDRTVPLPTQPDNHLSHYLEPNEILGSQSNCLWFDENDLIDAQYNQYLSSHTLSLSKSSGKKSSRRKGRNKSLKSKKGRHEDSQCSIM